MENSFGFLPRFSIALVLRIFRKTGENPQHHVFPFQTAFGSKRGAAASPFAKLRQQNLFRMKRALDGDGFSARLSTAAPALARSPPQAPTASRPQACPAATSSKVLSAALRIYRPWPHTLSKRIRARSRADLTRVPKRATMTIDHQATGGACT